jgi:hypothetical protein
MGALIQFVQMLGKALPPGVFAGLLIVLGVVAFPGWMRSIRGRQLRSQVRRIASATHQTQRQALEDGAIEMTGGRPRLLVTAADEAHRLHQLGLFQRALDALVATGQLPEDVRRLQRLVAAEPTVRLAHPLEAVVAVRRLIAEALPDLARARLNEALARFPDDVDLKELDAELRDVAARPSP